LIPAVNEREAAETSVCVRCLAASSLEALCVSGKHTDFVSTDANQEAGAVPDALWAGWVLLQHAATHKSAVRSARHAGNIVVRSSGKMSEFVAMAMHGQANGLIARVSSSSSYTIACKAKHSTSAYASMASRKRRIVERTVSEEAVLHMSHAA
jgi:hypothetical protein